MDATEKDLIDILYQTYCEKLYLVALHRVHNHEKALELVQEVFFIATFKANVLISHNNKLAWLYQVLNIVIKRDLYNKKYTKDEKLREIPLDADMQIYQEDSYFEQESELFKTLETVLNKREYKFLVDKFINDKSYKEIADNLGISYSGTTSFGDRVLKKVKKILKKRENKPPKMDI